MLGTINIRMAEMRERNQTHRFAASVDPDAERYHRAK